MLYWGNYVPYSSAERSSMDFMWPQRNSACQDDIFRVENHVYWMMQNTRIFIHGWNGNSLFLSLYDKTAPFGTPIDDKNCEALYKWSSDYTELGPFHLILW